VKREPGAQNSDDPRGGCENCTGLFDRLDQGDLRRSFPPNEAKCAGLLTVEHYAELERNGDAGSQVVIPTRAPPDPSDCGAPSSIRGPRERDEFHAP